jgi:hypothetical protein
MQVHTTEPVPSQQYSDNNSTPAATERAPQQNAPNTSEKRQQLARLTKLLRGAEQRCNRPGPGDRGHYAHVAFKFPSPSIGARQLLEKLGPIQPSHSLDRIDPRGHYEIDNIKYSTPTEQTANRIVKRRRHGDEEDEE